MANYECRCRTNYFHVENEEAFKEFMDHVRGEGYCELTPREDETGDRTWAFSCDSHLSGYVEDPNDDDYDCEEAFSAFIKGLQAHVREDDAVILTTIGYERMRYLVGTAAIITREKIQWLNLEDLAIQVARGLLLNPEWDTVNCY